MRESELEHLREDVQMIRTISDGYGPYVYSAADKTLPVMYDHKYSNLHLLQPFKHKHKCSAPCNLLEYILKLITNFE